MNPKEKKKTIFAAILFVIAGVWLYSAFSPSAPDGPKSADRPNKMDVLSDGPARPATPAGKKGRSITSGVDPSLRLDLLAKLQAVEYTGSDRNIFQFHVPPPPPPPTPLVGPVLPPPPQPRVEQAPPPPPPIPLKFYGIASAPGVSPKKAFFQKDDEIFVAVEGELVERRYRVVKINDTNVEMEDTQNKNKQRLPLIES